MHRALAARPAEAVARVAAFLEPMSAEPFRAKPEPLRRAAAAPSSVKRVSEVERAGAAAAILGRGVGEGLALLQIGEKARLGARRARLRRQAAARRARRQSGLRSRAARGGIAPATVLCIRDERLGTARRCARLAALAFRHIRTRCPASTCRRPNSTLERQTRSTTQRCHGAVEPKPHRPNRTQSRARPGGTLRWSRRVRLSRSFSVCRPRLHCVGVRWKSADESSRAWQRIMPELARVPMVVQPTELPANGI
jgi:hypothetical protein